MNSSERFDELYKVVQSKDNIAKLLQALADALNSMDAREFDQLMQGKAKLRIAKDRNFSKKSVPDSTMDKAVSDFVQKLKAADSRESAASLLASINQPRKRAFLNLIAQACGVRSGSKDSIARIEQMLVENVVGSRLDSEAIQKVAF